MRREQRTYLRRLFREFGGEGRFEDWLGRVTEIEVTLHPGARATAVDPEAVPVELRWDPETDEVMSFATRLTPGQPIPRREIRLSEYVAALAIARGVAGGPQIKVVGAELGLAMEVSAAGKITPVLGSSSRPAAGKAPNRDFYRALIAEVDALYQKGDHANPVAEVARRRGVQIGTVKSWLHRGRRYLKEEG